ncbi:MAG TPA: AMP-binding protein [Flavobacteriales bacterium]|nr:AMP-binding protein [Flavobacteriales bacterium]
MNRGSWQRLQVDGRWLEGKELQAFAHDLRTCDDTAEWAAPLAAVITDLSAKRGPLLMHTSGTTGTPKPIRISRNDLRASAALTAATFGLRPGDRALLCLPCDFVAGKMMVVRAMLLQLDLHLVDPRGSVLANLRTHDLFRFAALVPLQLHRALQEDKARLQRQFDTILLGGGPVSDALIEDLQDLDVAVFQGYGSTETVTHVALRRLNGPGRSTVFEAIGKVHFGRDPRGCLVVYTPHLSTTQHVTNDLVELIDDTHFHWLGRHDHVILSGGKKIFPEQLEARTAGVIPYPHYFTGVHDDVLGQAVMLVLETDRPQQEVLPEVLSSLMTTLHPHELPRRVQALRRIQRTSGGKIIRGGTT